MQVLVLILLVVFGGATIILHNPIFIKWKISIINWIFGVLFIGSLFVGKKPLIQHMLGDKIQLPEIVWKKLTISWGIFFILLGLANYYIMYHFSTNAWVNFKLYGIMGATLLMAIGQVFFLAKHLPKDER